MPWRTLVLAIVVAGLLGATLLLGGSRAKIQARLASRRGVVARLSRLVLSGTPAFVPVCGTVAALLTIVGHDMAAAAMLTVAAFWLVLDVDITLLALAGGTPSPGDAEPRPPASDRDDDRSDHRRDDQSDDVGVDRGDACDVEPVVLDVVLPGAATVLRSVA